MDKTNKNPNVPNLRFEEFHNEYTILPLEQCLKIKSGKSQKNIECNNGKYKIYGTGGIIGFTNKYLYDKESVGIGRKGTIDKPFYFNEPFWTVDTLFYSEIKENNVAKYIYYLFQTIPWKKYNTSTGVPSLTSSSIEAIEKGFPLKEEQYKIATFLSFIDKRIQTQSKIIEDLESVKNEISNRIFKLKLIEKSTKYLSEYLREGDKTPVDTFEYKKITIKLNKQGIVYSDINRDMADTRPFYIRHKDELIIGKQNYFNGSIAIVDEQYDNCICSNAIMSFNVVGINKEFLYFQLSNNNYLNSRSYKANGTGQKELSEKEFLNFKIWCPSIEEQIKIVNCFKAIDDKIKNEKAVLNSYMQEKDYLLTNMFI